jgi:uncharacterized protein
LQTPSTRNELIDALRALALLPVFAVNFASFVYGYETSSLGLTTPEDNWLAIASVWLTSCFFQNKGVVLLAFLVGLSLVLSSQASRKRGLSDAQFSSAQTVRLIKQALLGAAHGALLYFGDILLTYAVAGFFLLKLKRRKLKTLLRIALVLYGANLLLNAFGAIDNVMSLISEAEAWEGAEPEALLALATQWRDVWRVNFVQWGVGTTSQLFIVPLLALPPMLLGVAAARLQWLTHARWQAQRVRVARTLWPWALALHVLVATVYVMGIELRVKELENLGTAGASIAGPLGVAWFVAWAASRYSTALVQRCAHFLSPLGKYSLSSYLFGSIVMNLFFAGAGFAIAPYSALLLALAIAYWCACLGLAHVAVKRGWQGWPERWLSVKRHDHALK